MEENTNNDDGQTVPVFRGPKPPTTPGGQPTTPQQDAPTPSPATPAMPPSVPGNVATTAKPLAEEPTLKKSNNNPAPKKGGDEKPAPSKPAATPPPTPSPVKPAPPAVAPSVTHSRQNKISGLPKTEPEATPSPASPPPPLASLTGSPATIKPKGSIDTVTIRTMQDDLKERATTPAPASVKTSPPATPVAKAPSADSVAPQAASAAPAASTAPKLPLPPKKTSGKEKIILPPRQKQRQSKKIQALLVAALGLLILGSGGFAVWYGLSSGSINLAFLSGIFGSSTPGTSTVSAEEILPANNNLLVQYQLRSADDRAAIRTLWNAVGPESNTPVVALANGDPRAVLDDTALTELYYLSLPNEPRPYVVVPVTEGTTGLLGESGAVEVAEESGWYIVHSLDTEPYEQALSDGSLAAAGGYDILSADVPAAPVRLVLNEGMLNTIRGDMIGTAASAGLVTQLSLAGTVSGTTGLRVTGTAAVTGESAPAQVEDSELFTLIPATADTIRMGSNFSADLTAWQNQSQALNQAALDAPEVQSVITALTQPYAFIATANASGGHDYGLIINRTSAPDLTLGDPTLESGLESLLPFISESPPAASITFADHTYAEVPLRYANFSTPARALDYALTDTYLLIATSRESMFAIIDSVTGNGESIVTTSNTPEALLFWNEIPAFHDLVVGSSNRSLLKQLLPLSGENTTLNFGLAFQPDEVKTRVDGVIQLGPVEAATPPIEEIEETAPATEATEEPPAGPEEVTAPAL